VIRPSALLLAVACSSAAAFTVQPKLHRVAYPHRAPVGWRPTEGVCQMAFVRSPALSMVEQNDLPSFNVLGVAMQVLYGVLVLTAISGLVEKVPRLVSSPSGQLFDVVLDTIILGVAGSSLAKSLGLVDTVDYQALDDLDKNSLARQAGEWALAGQVPTLKDGFEVATFAGGCFWGTELHFQRMPGVIATCVGYTQGSVTKPSYEAVCSGTTGHTEGIQLIFDPTVISYSQLCEKLLSTVDPTAKNRVGNDRGTQYRHGVYPHSDSQAEAAASCIAVVQAKYELRVVTEVKPAAVFFPAENYHQRYLQKGGQSAEKDARQPVRCYG